MKEVEWPGSAARWLGHRGVVSRLGARGRKVKSATPETTGGSSFEERDAHHKRGNFTTLACRINVQFGCAGHHRFSNFNVDIADRIGCQSRLSANCGLDAVVCSERPGANT